MYEKVVESAVDLPHTRRKGRTGLVHYEAKEVVRGVFNVFYARRR